MKDEDIKHLAQLSRLEITDEEVKSYKKEITEILGFVEQIKDVSVDEPTYAKASAGDGFAIENAGVRNVFREDENPQESGKYTDDILENAPKTKDGYVEVQKILNTDDNAA